MSTSRARSILVAALALVAIVAGAASARQRWGRSPEDGLPSDRAGVPNWAIDPSVKDDVFTFVRIQYDSASGRGGPGRRGGGYYGGRGGGGRWAIDWPDSDLNFSFRLQQLTSLKVNPEPITLRLTDERLFDHPFIYIIEPGWLQFSEDEVAALRRYLENGGFLMVDDFWGDDEYENLRRQMLRVFPGREPTDLELDHEIFRCVYKLKEKPQVPSVEQARRGLSYEPYHGGNCRDVHYRGIFDDRERMMVIICHNTDLGDGWEREGDNADYFRDYSVKRAYPMGINIVTYAMTH